MRASFSNCELIVRPERATALGLISKRTFLSTMTKLQWAPAAAYPGRSPHKRIARRAQAASSALLCSPESSPSNTRCAANSSGTCSAKRTTIERPSMTFLSSASSRRPSNGFFPTTNTISGESFDSKLSFGHVV